MVAVPGVLLWYRDFGPRTSPQQLSQVAAAGRYAAALPGRGPVVVVYDNPDVLKALFYEGVFGAVLPPNLRHRLLIFPGTADDALANRFVPRGDSTERATARALFGDARPALRSGAPVLATRDLDPAGFLSGLGRGDPRRSRRSSSGSSTPCTSGSAASRNGISWSRFGRSRRAA